jgi:hypothetical protein
METTVLACGAVQPPRGLIFTPLARWTQSSMASLEHNRWGMRGSTQDVPACGAVRQALGSTSILQVPSRLLRWIRQVTSR